MRIAIPQWQGRVSPVFDVAANLLLVEANAGEEVGQQEIALTATGPIERARQVAQAGAEVLICCAISQPFELALQSAGVRVVSQICGGVGEVARSFLVGRLADGAFRMPGCCGRRRFRGGHGDGCAWQDGQTRMPGSRQRGMRRNRKRI